MLVRPIGRVRSAVTDPGGMPVGGREAVVEVFPDFIPALHRVEEYSHLWILSWFHEADSSTLQAEPKRVDESPPMYGVFALRSPARPNPICMSLVELACREGPEGRLLRVLGLDAVEGTPVLDIKPYNEHDTVFSVRTPRFRFADPVLRREWTRLLGLWHHQEECAWLDKALDVALLAEDELAGLQDPALSLRVRGPACLADVLQGLTHARLANPPRMRFEELPDGECPGGEGSGIEVGFRYADRRAAYVFVGGEGPQLDEAVVRSGWWRRVKAV